MSCTVLWRKFNPKKGKYVGRGSFRDILDKKYGFPAKLCQMDISYLEGMRDCGHEEAQILIDALYDEEEIEILCHQIKNLSERIDHIPDNTNDLENLSSSVCDLTEKLHGIGIEIYQLNSTLGSLKCAIERLREDRE